MQAISPILIGLGLLLPAAEPARLPETDPARLQETLRDRRDPAGQSQAALLLVQCPTEDAESAVRQALEQTEEVDVFSVLAGAVRLCQDDRFAEELLAALRSGRPPVRQAAAEALAVLPHSDLTRRLKETAADDKLELPVRQAALWVLGRSGRKDAIPILLEHLEGNNEALQGGAADALADVAGQGFSAWTPPAGREWWGRHKDMNNDRWMRNAAGLSVEPGAPGWRAIWRGLGCKCCVCNSRFIAGCRPRIGRITFNWRWSRTTRWCGRLPAIGRWNCCKARTLRSKKSWYRCCFD